MVLALCIFLEAYVLGSVPFGLLISKLIYRLDLRKYGSGNIGTTNAMRILGFWGGAGTFVLDTLKGYAAGVLALVFVALSAGTDVGAFVWLSITPAVAPAQNALWVGVAVFGGTVGHVFSPWLGFKGGKGVAVAAGCLFVWFGWLVGAVELGIFALTVVLSKYVSLGSLVATLGCPLFAMVLFWGDWAAVACGVLSCALIYWAHRENIERLLRGTERKVGKAREAAGE